MPKGSPQLVLTDEQNELRATVRRMVHDLSPLEVVRRQIDSGEGYDPKVWRTMAGEVGLLAVAVPEELGGLGLGPVEQWLLFEELGRGLYPGPFLATAGMAIPALLAASDKQAAAELLPAILAGETVATLAVAEHDGRWDPNRTMESSARVAGGAWTLNGGKSFVVDGLAADLILVIAVTETGSSLFAVEATAPGLRRDEMDSLDLTRGIAKLTFESVPARLIGAEGAGEGIVASVLDSILLAVAAEQAGGAAACLDGAVAYAKIREQFGKPIGAFQAVAHKLVDMFAEVHFARSASFYAAACAAAGSDEFLQAVRIAAAYSARAYRRVTTEAIQVYGGTGFTWEHDAHLFYRRAWSTQQLFGDPAAQWLVIADRVGLR